MEMIQYKDDANDKVMNMSEMQDQYVAVDSTSDYINKFENYFEVANGLKIFSSKATVHIMEKVFPGKGVQLMQILRNKCSSDETQFMSCLTTEQRMVLLFNIFKCKTLFDGE